MAKLPSFEVVKLQPLDGMGALRAYASVSIANRFTVHEFRIIQQDGQAAWVSGPQKTWTDETGKKRFSTLFEIGDKEWRQALTAAILEAWQDFPDGIKRQQPAAFREEVREKARIGGPA